jgi:hypothetical protein
MNNDFQNSSNNNSPAKVTEKSLTDKAPDRLGLEEIVHLSNKIGLEYVDAKKDADRLELLKPSIRAKIAIRLEAREEKISEAKLKRLTETDTEYTDYLEELISAKAECDRLKVRYESYKNLFDARRSLLSYQKAEMKLI